VKDRSGAVIARALVVLSADGQEFSRVTQPNGTFVFTGVQGASGSVTVSAPGFATSTTALQAGQNDLSITRKVWMSFRKLSMDLSSGSFDSSSGSLTWRPVSLASSSRRLRFWASSASAGVTPAAARRRRPFSLHSIRKRVFDGQRRRPSRRVRGAYSASPTRS